MRPSNGPVPQEAFMAVLKLDEQRGCSNRSLRGG